MVPARALLVTVLLTMLAFAVSLFLGILGVLVGARLRGGTPNMSIAYRDVAIPVAAVIGVIVLVSAMSMEVRHYRHSKALKSIERAG
jgi:hypothetical protein